MRSREMVLYLDLDSGIKWTLVSSPQFAQVHLFLSLPEHRNLIAGISSVVGCNIKFLLGSPFARISRSVHGRSERICNL